MNRKELLKAAKPILFNTDMVRAILDGKKTETRRVIKFPVNKYTKRRPIADNLEISKKHLISLLKKVYFDEKPSYCIGVKKPYQPGDILYVRETWEWNPCWDCGLDTEKNGCPYEHERIYNQKNRKYGCYCYKASLDDGDTPSVGTWHPSIHMPKEAARIFLKVTDIRPERLQDIDDNGVVAEGLQIGDPFDDLWNSIIKKSDQDRYGWDTNPWVWVIKFKKLEGEINNE